MRFVRENDILACPGDDEGDVMRAGRQDEFAGKQSVEGMIRAKPGRSVRRIPVGEQSAVAAVVELFNVSLGAAGVVKIVFS
jgi:hypothetical protein